MSEFTDDTRMPFGIHKNKKLSQIPIGYFINLNKTYNEKQQTKALTNFEKKLRGYMDENFNF
jgi:hypothetical protein